MRTVNRRMRIVGMISLMSLSVTCLFSSSGTLVAVFAFAAGFVGETPFSTYTMNEVIMPNLQLGGQAVCEFFPYFCNVFTIAVMLITSTTSPTSSCMHIQFLWRLGDQLVDKLPFSGKLIYLFTDCYTIIIVVQLWPV